MKTSLLSRKTARARMARLLALCALTLLVAVIIWPHGAQAGAQDVNETGHTKPQAPHADSVPGEILVRFRTGAAATKQPASSVLTLRAAGTDVPVRVERFEASEAVEGLRLAHVAPEQTEAAIVALRARPDVLYAEPNFIRHKSATPSDPRFNELWGLQNTGQSGGAAGADIGAVQAWDTTTGSRNVVVAVIDEGIDVNHPDLQQNIWRNPGEIPNNGVDDDGDGYVDDVNGFDFVHNDGTVFDGANDATNETDAHGTHVAGTIGAVGNNGVGVVGVNWQVSLMSLKFLGADGGTTSDLLRALAYAKLMRDRWVSSGGTQGANVRVTNNSYGGAGYSQAEFDAISALNDSGILFVAAAGNESEDNNTVHAYPATYDLPNIISVAALDRTDKLASFSNRGARTVHLGAPGAAVLSTTPNNTYSYFDGTSMASPHVAGTAALVLAAHPDFTLARLRAALLFGGTTTQVLDATTITGRRVSATGALQNATEIDTTPPTAVNDLHIAAQDGRNVLLAWTATGDDGQTGQASLAEIRFVDQATGASFRLYNSRPAVAGTAQSATLNIPYRHATGSFILRVTDNAGNATTANIAVADNPAELAEPYAVTTSSPAPLTTGGQHLNVTYDDFITTYILPFNFPYYDRYFSQVHFSTNGALYFGQLPRSDFANLHETLNGRYMIAGLWDDLDLRACMRSDADVYVVKPDNDRVIFRWQGVRFNALECGSGPAGDPVNFEVELRRDGTIQMRYGDNPKVAPVVGIGGNEPEAYLISSHTSENAPVSLTNAPALNFALRTPPRQADLRVDYGAYPNPVLIGQNFTLTVTATNHGPDRASNVVVTDTLGQQAAFVSCSTPQGTCTGPATNPGGIVTFNLGSLASGATVTAQIVLTATTYADTGFTNAVVINSPTYDPSTFDNSSSFYTSLVRPNATPLTSISAIAAGSAHVLALRTDGTALAWGANGNGQLGDGTHTTRQQPARIAGLTGVRVLDAGGMHSIAVRTNGTVWTWGSNFFGQLGDGTTTDRKIPAPVDGLTNIVAVAAGAQHNLALSSDGTVWAWGDGIRGQLGDGTISRHLRPVQIAGLDHVRAIAAGGNFSLALKTDGTVWAWGANDSGQLGDGTMTSRNAPVPVNGLTNVVALDASNTYPYTNVDMAYSCALKADGTVWMWGANFEGQLADGTVTNRPTPAQVASLTSVTAVALGNRHALALKSDGTVWAWGANNNGQLGDESNAFNRHTAPTPVLWLTNVTAIAAGNDYSLALRQDGHLWSWGTNWAGQLGGNGTTDRNFPYEVNDKVPDPPPVGTVAMPVFNPPGGVYGNSQNVTITSATEGMRASRILAGGHYTIAQLTDGTFYGWGDNQSAQLGLAPGNGFGTPDPAKAVLPTPTIINGLSNVASFTAGFSHNLVLKTDGTVWAWGADNFGQLGDGIVPLWRAQIAQVPNLTNVVAVDAGGNGSAALKADGTVWYWGAGGINGSTGFATASPTQVNGLTNVTAISVGSGHVMALRSDGTVWTWGDNYYGQLGDGTAANSRTTPAQVAGLADVVMITAGSAHSVAVKRDGTVWAWGRNVDGECGNSDTVDFSNQTHPVQVLNLNGVTALAAGVGFTVALKPDGTVWAWGTNYHSELGVGQGLHRTPVQVAGLTNVTAISTGLSHTVALTADGTIWTWGLNDNSQLGDGSTEEQSNPMLMTRLSGGVIIHYTTDGREPTEDDPSINSGASVLVDRTLTLKAKAFKFSWTPSGTRTASYTLVSGTLPTLVQFSDATYEAPEGAGQATITVTRTGDTSGTTAVAYATVDNPAAVRCDDTTTLPGVAFARCDYATTIDTLTFTPGETTKTFTVPLIDDAHVEGNETVALQLSNPVGGTLGAQATATLTITDNDGGVVSANPIMAADPKFFVRQHYLDFLSREPEQGEPWSGVLRGCQNQFNTDPTNPAAGCDRLIVSQSFFGSPEFQLKGFYVFLFYKVALGRLPQYTEVIPDMRSVSGQTPQEVYSKRAQFAESFVQRSEFSGAYATMPNDVYVAALLNRYNLTSINTPDPASPDTGATITLTQTDLINRLNAQTLTRAQVLRAIVQSREVGDREFNGAFVAMQYYGYLRRTPETGGYNNWLNYLNAHPTDARTMVNGFMNSTEYKLRFGPTQ